MNKRASVSSVFTECLIRDNHTCQDCGSQKDLEVHHILPISQGGKNELSNLKTVCSTCHTVNYKDVHYPKDKTLLVPFDKREKQRSGIDKSKHSQILVTLPNELAEEIEEYWHAKKLKNRSEAIRELIKEGLKRE